ncbi:MAG: GNAT family N-acetyltransferase [Alphaproteobacteria bacterium]|nr:GNAT family N-acetyltransferase [Alphaproteobacteria bacterium]
MTVLPAGTPVDYTVTWLEMTERPGYGYPPLPANQPASLLQASLPPVWFFLSLYDAVGRDYAWEDAHSRDEDELQGWLSDPKVALFTLMAQGWPHGFFMLDGREAGTCDLAYFGMVPQAVGRGLGTWLLRTAILTAWDRPLVERLTVNTCTLDHPRALQTYQKNGFTPVRRQDFTRVLQRPRDLTRIPD